ncbi:hypothetical protein VTI74DRAFT_2735 [Chaetomium olivicolor]
MRLSKVLFPLLWAGLALAYGLRGAYEKAMYFAIYQLEDMLAIDGVGGARKGLLGKSRRCSLPQFLDHIWRATPTNKDGAVYFDTKPVLSDVKWSVSDEVLKSSALTTAKIQNYIMNARAKVNDKKLIRDDEIDLPSGQKVKVKQRGYAGNVDEPGKLWPTSVSWT